jgi:hypothetical protein
MRLWDLDSELLFPRQTVVAYVKNVLHFSGSGLDVRALIATHPLYHRLRAVTPDGQSAELLAPYAVSGVRRMYIPFVFQRSFTMPKEYRWSVDGRRTQGCFKVGAQREGDDFWLVTSRGAVMRYARSGRPRDFMDAETYPRKVSEFVSKSLDDDWIQETFRFADVDGVSRVVPFHPIVLNQEIQTEYRHGRPALPDYTQTGQSAR